jgi:hypothetical protein
MFRTLAVRWTSWKRSGALARRYARYSPERLFFEVLNEPVVGARIWSIQGPRLDGFGFVRRSSGREEIDEPIARALIGD